MKRIPLLIWIVLAGCASAPFYPPAGLAKRYAHMGVTVRSPSEANWHLMQFNHSGVVFGKKFEGQTESAIANTALFAVPLQGDDASFLRHIMSEREKNDDKIRFKILSVENTLTQFKGASCFRYKIVSEDHGAKGLASSATQYLKALGMVCRHPCE